MQYYNTPDSIFVFFEPLKIPCDINEKQILNFVNVEICTFIYSNKNTRQADNFRKYKIKQIPKMDILYPRYSRQKQENNGVGDISSLFQKHCQTNTSIGLTMFLD